MSFALTLSGIDPTTFNFLSDVVSVIGRWALGLALTSYLYVVVMTWQVRSGRSIPVKALGDIPEDFFAAADPPLQKTLSPHRSRPDTGGSSSHRHRPRLVASVRRPDRGLPRRFRFPLKRTTMIGRWPRSSRPKRGGGP